MYRQRWCPSSSPQEQSKIDFFRGFQRSPPQKKGPPEALWHRGGGKKKVRRRAIFPGRHRPSIVAACSLYGRVRDGNGWTPEAKSPNQIVEGLRLP